MLSRVAEHIYWFGRYTERAENTARLLKVNTTLLLDLPPKITFGWGHLPRIAGCQEAFDEHHEQADENNVVHFLILDERNPSSILSSLRSARENMRTTRDLMPREVWEQVNRLYYRVREQGQQAMSRQRRHEFLDQIILDANMISGLLFGGMSNDQAFRFLHIGIDIERADMTTRIIDVRSESLLPEQSEDIMPFLNIQWMSMLRSLTAYQMYRRHIRRRVNGPDVLRFLLQNTEFPRAVVFCLNRLNSTLLQLPHSEPCINQVIQLRTHVAGGEFHQLIEQGLSEFLDQIQLELNTLHSCLHKHYFAVEEQGESQSQFSRSD